MHTVTVNVLEHEVADGNRHEDAHVERQVCRAGHEERRRRGAARRAVGIRVERIVATLVAEGDHRTGREGVEIELDEVRARREVGEAVDAAAVGRGRCNLDRITGHRIDQEQRDAHTGNTWLERILHAVTIEIVPHQVTDPNREVDAQVEGEVRGA